MHDALTIFGTLRDEFLCYYETPFAVRDPSVMRERRALLEEDAAIAREPWLEPVAPYASVPHALEESCRRTGAAAELAEFAQLGLIDPSHTLRTHQEHALAAAQAGRHVVITAG